MDGRGNSARSATGGIMHNDAGPAQRRRRLTRDELAPEARETIFRAAVEVVGQYGYAGTSIGRVTQAAGIAQGTFYLYFASRQALLDQLLPHAGAQMLDFIRQRVAGSRDIFEKEERGFRAFFDYMKVNPGFFRLLTEAPGAAPRAHAQHFELVTRPYVAALRRGTATQGIRQFAEDELETIAYMLMAAREYLYLRYLAEAASDAAAIDTVVKTYMKFVRNGLGKA